jgi:hypothetical protein
MDIFPTPFVILYAYARVVIFYNRYHPTFYYQPIEKEKPTPKRSAGGAFWHLRNVVRTGSNNAKRRLNVITTHAPGVAKFQENLLTRNCTIWMCITSNHIGNFTETISKLTTYPIWSVCVVLAMWLLKKRSKNRLASQKWELAKANITRSAGHRAIGANAPYTALMYSSCGYPTALNRLEAA